MSVILSKEMRILDVSVPPPVGTTWLYEYGDDGTFDVPATGIYKVEIHGGGGGGARVMANQDQNNSSDYYIVITRGGGGSGEIYINVSLTKGDKIPVTIGAGGTTKYVQRPGNTTTSVTVSGTDGGTSRFGDYSCSGGLRAHIDVTPESAYGGVGSYTCYHATGSGSLASDAPDVSFDHTASVAGGQGNVNDTNQTYGDGGGFTKGDTPNYVAIYNKYNGQPGAIIITFLGGS